MVKAAHVLNGKEIAQKILVSAAKKIGLLKKTGASLTLATVQVGNAKDTLLYSQALEALLNKVGIGHLPSVSPQNITEAELCQKIGSLNEDPAVTGIMVFAPLPATLDTTVILSAVDQAKDVEGRTFMKSHFGVFSPTANAVMALLEESGVDLAGKEAVVIGHSDLVGKPTAILLLDRMATVTVCHAKTVDLRKKIERADIVVAAVGRPELVKGDWIKPGAVVIDVGENFVGGKLVGDVEFSAAKKKASYLSPVPGGVGPVTNVMLIQNLLRLHSLKALRNGNS